MKNDQKIRKTVDYYDRLSGKYDSGYSAYLKHTHASLLPHLDINADDNILDVSGGTGLLALQLIESGVTFKKLILNDPSEGMLNVAKERLSSIENIEFTNHTAEEIPFDNGRFDMIICLNSFHYYSDHEAVMENFYRVLKPGGTLYVQDWNLEGWFYLPNAIISTLSPENINSVSVDKMKLLLTDYGFTVSDDDTWWFRFWKFFRVKAVKPSK